MTLFQIRLVLFLIAFCTQSFAKTTEPACNPKDWSCHGSFYVTTGGVFSHVFYKPNPLTFNPPNQPVIQFSPSTHFPANLGGFRFGFGNGVDKKLPVNYEFDYNETFYQAKQSDEILAGISTKSLVSSLSYALNPKCRLKASVFAGAVVVSVYLTTQTVAPKPEFFATTNSVDIDPFAGGSLLYQINSKFAVRLVEFYDLGNYNKNLSGRLVTLFMLNYYPA